MLPENIRAITNKLNAPDANFVVKSAEISNLISYAETKIPKVNTSTQISPEEVKNFIDIVALLVQEIKEIDRQFLSKGTDAVFLALRSKTGGKVADNNATTLMYMYNSSNVNNNFKKLVKPGSGTFMYKQTVQLPKISDMNAILESIKLNTITNANINSLVQTAKNRTPTVAARLTRLSRGIQNVLQQGKNKFQNIKSYYGLQMAQKKLENAKKRTNSIVPVNTPMNTTLEVANAISENNAKNIRRLIQNNSFTNNAIQNIAKQNNTFLKEFRDAPTNNDKKVVLRKFTNFSNALNRASASKSIVNTAILKAKANAGE